MTRSAAGRQLLQRPEVAVRVGEPDEGPPRLDVDLAGIDSVGEQVGARLRGIIDHDLDSALSAGRHVHAQPLTERDGAGRARWSQLDETQLLADSLVEVGVEADLVDVERLGAVDVGDGHEDELDLPVHVRKVRPTYDRNGGHQVKPATPAGRAARLRPCTSRDWSSSARTPSRA